MKKIFLVIISLLIVVMLFGLSISNVNAGYNFFSGLKRRVKYFYYHGVRKPIPTVELRIKPYRQKHALSCEFAALKMALRAKNINVAEKDLISKAHFEPMGGDPQRGFVGNINGRMLKTGYGIYWRPIAEIANEYRPAEDFNNWTIRRLTSETNQGNPVIVWGYVGRGRKVIWYTRGGKKINGVTGEHARVAIGFSGRAENPQRIYLIDPIYGKIYWSTKKFRQNWGAFQNSGVVIR